MFHGLTMVNFDGQTQNQMMVRPWSTMVDHGQPWSDGQTVAGADYQYENICRFDAFLPQKFCKEEYWTGFIEFLVNFGSLS